MNIKNKPVGIILAAGFGTRLKPMTRYINKHLLPIYNKPMIYYSISLLKKSKIKNIYIICSKNDHKIYLSILNTGKEFGLKINYLFQSENDGIAGALKVFRDNFDINSNRKLVTLLGDNLFFGQGLYEFFISKALISKNKFSIFCKTHNEPKNFGVLNIKNNKALEIIEKPKKFISNIIVTGLYVFNSQCLTELDKIKKSEFNQFEITDFINIFLKRKQCEHFLFGEGMSWFDCGTPESLFQASSFIGNYYKNFNIDIGCIDD